MPSIQEQIQSISEKYQPDIDRLSAEAKELQESFNKPESWEAMINVDFEVGWKDQDFSFDIPTVTMRLQSLSLDLPEFQMDQQTIVFHTPSVKMVDRVVGRYPEWHGPFKVVWKDIIISVPEPFMQEQRIILDIPSVTMKTQEFKLDLPEFRMETVRFVVGLPQVTIKKVSAETARVKDAGEALRVKGEKIAGQMKSEIEALVGGAVASSEVQATSAKNKIGEQYDQAISALNKAIDDLVAKGVDPIKVPAESGEINLRKQLADLISKREQALSGIPERQHALEEKAVA